MAVTNYYTVNDKIRGEGTAAGGFRPYGHDALGTVVATYDSTGALQNTYRNAPYGTQVAKTGTAADPRFLYNGGSGYRTTGRTIRLTMYGSGILTTRPLSGRRLIRCGPISRHMSTSIARPAYSSTLPGFRRVSLRSPEPLHWTTGTQPAGA